MKKPKLRTSLMNGRSVLFVYFTILIIVIIACGFSPLYFYLSKSLKSEVNASSEGILQQVISNSDNNLKQLEDKLLRISVNKNLEQVLYKTNNSLYDNRADYIKDIGLLSSDIFYEQMDNQYIDLIYVYLDDLKFIIGGQSYSELDSFYDRNFINQQMGGYKNNKPTLTKKIFRIIGSQKKVISLVRDFRVNNPKYQGMTVININPDFLTILTNKLNSFSKATIYLTNDKGDIISSSGTIINNISEIGIDAHYQTHSNRTWEQKIKGKTALIFQRISPKNNWRYYIIVPKSAIFNSLDIARNVTFLITFLCLLIGVIISLFLTRSYYKPIGRLVNYIRKESLQKDDQNNDFALLDQSFRQIFNENKFNEKIVKEHWQDIKNKVLIDLLKGNLKNNPNSHEKMNTYGINLLNPYFQVVTFEIDDIQSLNATSGMDESLIIYAASNMVVEVMTAFKSTQIVRVNDRMVSILLNTLEKIDENTLLATIAELQQLIQKYLNISTSYAIGNTFNEFDEIEKSFRETLSVLKRKVFLGSGSITFYDQVDLGIETVLNEDKLYSIRDNMLAALKIKNIDILESHIDKLFSYIEENPYISTDYIQFILFFILEDAAHLMYQLFGQVTEEFNNQITVMQNLKKCKDIKEYKYLFRDYYKKVTEYLITKSGNSRNELIENVLKFISENYDKDLSLEMVADKTHFNPKYLGRLIKSVTNKTYLIYLTEIRMEKAKELLADHKLKITEICVKVGFMNRQSFLRTFKQYTGMTPSEYREKLSQITN